MLRVCVSVLCVGAIYLLVAAAPDPATPTRTLTRPDAAIDRSCKPQGPVDVVLRQAESSAGARVDLEWAVRPERALKSMTWELRLPEDGVLLEGERAGAAAPERDVMTRGATSVSLPVDGNYRQATLVVHGVFEGSDETGATFDEPFSVVKHLSWGEPPAVGSIMLSRDVETGEMTSFIALPTAHREGR
jgi:hypothetical protein